VQVASALDTALSLGSPPAAAPAAEQPLRALVPTASAEALDLLTQLLRFDPRKRISAVDALAHPYLADLHEEAAEPAAVEAFALELEGDAALDWAQLRSMYCEIALDSLRGRQARAKERGARADADADDAPEPKGGGASAVAAAERPAKRARGAAE
jgi:hypothetical protein